MDSIYFKTVQLVTEMRSEKITSTFSSSKFIHIYVTEIYSQLIYSQKSAILSSKTTIIRPTKEF